MRRCSPDSKAIAPKRVLFPRNYYADHEYVQTAGEDWVQRFSQWLGAEIDRTTIDEKWDATKPSEVDGSFDDHLSKV